MDNANGILNGHRNEPLTPLGIKQAHQLAVGIKDAGLAFDAVYTSPLWRAKETAEIVCETLGISMPGMLGPEVLDSLIERDFGVMTGKKASEIEKLCAPDIVKTDTITYFLHPPGAETFPDLVERAKRVIDDITTKHKGGSVLLVTHGDIGKSLYCAYYKLNWLDILTQFHFGNCELLLLAEDANPNEPHVVKIEQYNH
ncbi:MAG: histidine phosphatase family protein [Candidatus Doudnabacteria bacterium]|nr:histidine phosphatase family protein [Candidatus Doudnabacteria bacterium]